MQTLVAATAAVTQQGVRLVHVQPGLLGDDTLGLFDHDPIGERGLQPLDDHVTTTHGTFGH